MKNIINVPRHYTLSVLLAVSFLTLLTNPVVADDYAALEGVNGLNTVYDVSQASPKVSNLVFWAVRDVYQNDSVSALPNPPRTVVVFHGPAVKLISTERKWFKPEEVAEVDKFADTIRQMKKDGVTFEICDYAAKVMGVDPATIMPEIDHVANGFVSVAGYQAQGYSVVRIP
jgi:intracellular sulfur oxidation DsrE/DsrF family protein